MSSGASDSFALGFVLHQESFLKLDECLDICFCGVHDTPHLCGGSGCGCSSGGGGGGVLEASIQRDDINLVAV